MRTIAGAVLLSLVSVSASSAAAVSARKVECLGLPSCYAISNGDAEVVVTTDVGPRVAAYRLGGGENILAELPDTRPNDEFRIWGGHRLWLAPEARERTTVPDNRPVEMRREADGTVRLVGPVDATGMQREISVRLDPAGSGVTVGHRVTNRSLWAVALAPWAITILRGGGTGLIPQEPYRRHEESLLPVRSMALWSYTSMADPRLTFGAKYIRVRTDAAIGEPLKIGVGNTPGWMAYHQGRTLFVKRFAYEAGATYPDLGSNSEIYTQRTFIELESLAPLRTLEPGGVASHEERWFLFDGVELGPTDAAVESALAGPLARTR